MKAVGLRELKNKLSEYIREVRSGERVLVTDRGEVVAELSPPGLTVSASPVPAGLEALARRGQATLGHPRRDYPSLSPLLPPGRAAALLAEERGGR